MPEITFSNSNVKGPITIKRADYDTATGILFKFPEAKAGFQVPDDVTILEMIEILEKVSTALKDKKSILFVPPRYAHERLDWIKKMKEEENA